MTTVVNLQLPPLERCTVSRLGAPNHVANAATYVRNDFGCTSDLQELVHDDAAWLKTNYSHSRPEIAFRDEPPLTFTRALLICGAMSGCSGALKMVSA